MVKSKVANKTSIRRNKSYVGERIEDRVKRLVYSGEALGDGAPLIYTDRRRGVQPEYNIRTDKWDLALDTLDKTNKNELVKRAEFYKNPESIDATAGSAPEGGKEA